MQSEILDLNGRKYIKKIATVIANYFVDHARCIEIINLRVNTINRFAYCLTGCDFKLTVIICENKQLMKR